MSTSCSAREHPGTGNTENSHPPSIPQHLKSPATGSTQNSRPPSILPDRKPSGEGSAEGNTQDATAKNPTVPVALVIVGFSFPAVLFFAFERLRDRRNRPEKALLVIQLPAGFLAQLVPWDKMGHGITSFPYSPEQA